MIIGFNDTKYITLGNMLAGFGNVAGALVVATVGFGASLLAQKVAHKIAANFFHIQPKDTLVTVKLGSGFIAGIAVTAPLACYCPRYSASIGKVTKFAILSVVSSAISYGISGNPVKIPVSIALMAGTGGALMGFIGAPAYVAVGLIGVAAGSVYGVNDGYELTS